MKKLHVVILVAAAIAVGTVISLYGNTSRYVCFDEAAAIEREHPGTELHVVTTINKEKEQVYDPMKDPNYYSFYARDTAGVEKRVVYYNAYDPEFEKTDKLVLIGNLKGDVFEAKKILKKCPSKYEKNLAATNP
jgi:cytochrome c-type biogenesis protein CcmE